MKGKLYWHHLQPAPINLQINHKLLTNRNSIAFIQFLSFNSSSTGCQINTTKRYSVHEPTVSNHESATWHLKIHHHLPQPPWPNGNQFEDIHWPKVQKNHNNKIINWYSWSTFHYPKVKPNWREEEWYKLNANYSSSITYDGRQSFPSHGLE